MPRRGSAGATLFALENEFSMPFGRLEICSEVHIYICILYSRLNEFSQSFHFASPRVFLRLVRACYVAKTIVIVRG